MIQTSERSPVSATAVQIPALCRIQRKLNRADPVDPVQQLRSEWARLALADAVRGKRIALGIGSRGVAEIPAIARTLVACVRESGGDPFIVPAMGSHGGATAPGQIAVLESLGVTEKSAGCPIHATMEVVTLGETPRGLPVYFDRLAAEADGVIVVNRVKEHTDFHGPTESGMVKMLAIGLGKERGASLHHNFGVVGIRDYVPESAELILKSGHIIAGIGTVEDGYHRLAHLEAFRPHDLVAGERRLLGMARHMLPRLPADAIDVLIIDEIGKEISGTGMDSNVIGRLYIDGAAEPERPRIKAIVVLDLSQATHGNAIGVGFADFTTRQLLDKIDFAITNRNMITSGFLRRGFIPLVLPTKAEAVDAAITHVFRAHPQDREAARIVRIQNTLILDDIWVSAALLPEIQAEPGFINAGAPEPMRFDD
jgi:hypothetical protein